MLGLFIFQNNRRLWKVIAVKRLIEILEEKLEKVIGLHEIGYETVWLMHEEIDERLVPLHVIAHLAEPVICESANYTDKKGDYYTLIVVETGNIENYEVLLKNDEVVKHSEQEDSI